jgi:hypothetical protein
MAVCSGASALSSLSDETTREDGRQTGSWQRFMAHMALNGYTSPPLAGALLRILRLTRMPLSVLERSLHFGTRTSITTPLRSKGLEFGLSCSCTLKYANS